AVGRVHRGVEEDEPRKRAYLEDCRGPCSAERAALICEAAATTMSPDCDRRSRLPLMRLRASRAALRLVASCRCAWLTSEPMCGIFARFGKLCTGAAAAR